ncbi:fermentation-respiration switch protein FrsA (DUF1100 family) [Rhizobium mongolense]
MVWRLGPNEMKGTRGHAAVSATRLLVILPLMAAFVYLALVGLVYFSQRALLFPGASATPSPERARWGENVSIQTPDGEALHGLYSQGEFDKPCVLLFFGNGDLVDNYGFLARALAARGVGMLAISYRGYPESTGSPSEEGLLTDGIAAFALRDSYDERVSSIRRASIAAMKSQNEARMNPVYETVHAALTRSSLGDLGDRERHIREHLADELEDPLPLVAAFRASLV